jgi:hypothetical protein
MGSLGESGGPTVRKGEESVVETRDLQGCSPRLIGLRTEGLVPASKYWIYWSHVGDMIPVNWCRRSSTDACLFPTTSMAVRGEKLGGGLRIGQPACCRLGRVLFFSGAVVTPCFCNRTKPQKLSIQPNRYVCCIYVIAYFIFDWCVLLYFILWVGTQRKLDLIWISIG